MIEMPPESKAALRKYLAELDLKRRTQERIKALERARRHRMYALFGAIGFVAGVLVGVLL